jgi:hypothetical protein
MRDEFDVIVLDEKAEPLVEVVLVHEIEFIGQMFHESLLYPV